MIQEITTPTEQTPTAIENDLKKLEAFVSEEEQVQGLTLRPVTAGSLILLRMTKNPLLDGLETVEDIEFHVAGFLYLHSADPKEVRKAARNKEQYMDKVLEFAESLSIPSFVKAATQIREILTNASAGSDFEVVDSGEKKTKV